MALDDDSKMQEALRLSEERYRTLLEATFEGLIIIQEGSIVEANPGAGRIFGYEPGEMTGLSPLTIVSPEWREAVMDFIEKDYDKPHELVGLRKDDSTVEIEVIGKQMPYYGGRARVAAVRDISDRKRAVKALVESEERNRTLLEATFGGIVVQQEGRIIEVNPGAAAIFGYDAREMIGMDPTELVAPEHRSLVSERTEGDFSKPYEFTGLRRDGKRIDIEAIGKRMSHRGRLARVAAVRDITPRKLAEKELRESEERFRDLFDNANDLIQSVDPQGKFLAVNRKWRETLGYSREEVEDLTLWHVIHPDHWNHFRAAFEDVMRVGRMECVEVAFVTRGGKRVELDGNVSCRKRSDGSVATIGIFRDVTDKKDAESELVDERNKARLYLDALTRDVSRLNSDIASDLEALLGEDGHDERLQMAVQQLLERTTSVERTIESVVMLAELMDRETRLLPVDLSPMVKRSLDRVVKENEDRHVQVKTGLPQGAIMVLGNRFLDDVVWALVDNAVRFNTEEVALVEVSVRRSEDQTAWVLEVADNGPGIRDEMKETIFRRLNLASSGQCLTGLGLTIVQEAMERVGGRAWVEDRVAGDPGQGSRFTLLLPEGEKAAEAVKGDAQVDAVDAVKEGPKRFIPW